jgi:hypothetical protein
MNELPGGKAKIEKGVISAFIYDQEGNLIPFTVKDSPLNRFFVEYVQRHDRYSGTGKVA